MCVGINVFLEHSVMQLKKLEQEILLVPEIPKYTSFYLITAVFDKPAKAAVLNMEAFNGFGGCTKCLQLRETLKGNFLIAEKLTFSRILIYRFQYTYLSL